jgi:putative hemolysin
LIWQKFELEVIDMDGVKIDKVMVKALKGKIVSSSFSIKIV